MPDSLPISDDTEDAVSPSPPPARAGGSSRRRRGKKKQGKWGTRLLVALGILVALAAIAWFGFGLWLKGYLRSEEFQNNLSDQLAGTLKAKSTFTDLTWSDSTVRLGNMAATGYKDADFATVSVDDIRADVKLALMDRKVEVPTINISKLKLTVAEDGRLPLTFAEARSKAGNEALEHHEPRKESFFDSFKPTEFILGETRIEDAQVSVKTKEGEIRLLALPLTLKTDKTFEVWNIESHPRKDTAVLVTNLGEGMRLKIADISARLRTGQIDLLNFEGELGRLKDTTNGGKEEFAPTRLTARGNYTADKRHPSVELETTITDLKLQEWAREDWVKRLAGTADIKAHLSGDPSSSDRMELRGTFAMKNGVLTSLPVLTNLAEKTKAAEFLRLDLNTARWDFNVQGKTWKFDKIIVEARGLMRLEGYVNITNGEVKGVLQVGVTPGRLRAIDGAEQKVFTREENGYKWANPPMRLWGNIDDIQEDLGGRIKDAWLNQQIDNVTELATKAPEAMLQNSGKILEGGSKVIEEGVKAAPNLINEGVNMLNGFFGPKGK